MLLTEYNEQAHIENEREIAKEEGIKEGMREGREQEQRRLRTLIAKMAAAGETDCLIRLADTDFLQEMFEKYRI